VSEDFGICFGKEKVSVGREFITECTMVFDDPVVDESDAIFTTWVGIFLSGRSVGGPASVSDAAG